MESGVQQYRMKDKQYRHEFKFICTDSHIALLQNRLNTLMELDPNVKQGDSYRIRSLYLDDYLSTGFYDNEERD